MIDEPMREHAMEASTERDELTFWSFIETAKQGLGERGFEELEATEILLALNRASNVVTYDLESAIHRARGRSWAAFRLMFVVWLAGPVEPKKAAELAGMTRSAVSNLSKSLVSDGLMARTPADEDGRSVLLHISHSGDQELLEIFQEQRERERTWVGALTPAEQAVLLMLLTKLIADRTDFDVKERR
ncbi:MarR family winged helix-turn-helix transcriptional regulator [Nocardia jejuensis]|uniref:MarR family winged helix-turn-helix transcriptional regulator n=1 Tax=Nocardia jejuensis TaxID=328049 RepID=UPI000B0A46AA|nr:MarR family transcriptional regulator [Nocardia jejuensis]